MDVPRWVVPHLLPLLLKEPRIGQTQIEIDILLADQTLSPDLRLEAWRELALSIGIKGFLTKNLRATKDNVFNLLTLSNTYVAREELAAKLGIDEVVIGTRCSFQGHNGTVTLLQPSGEIQLTFDTPLPNGYKKSSVDPGNCDPVIEPNSSQEVES